MIKKLFFLILSLGFSASLCWADTCPRMQEVLEHLPPPGWTLLVDPDLELKKYHFSSAIHSLNGSFYFEQVICRYDVCASYGCPAFALLSENLYEEPTEANPPWNHRSVIGYTLTCMPGDHRPEHCVFE